MIQLFNIPEAQKFERANKGGGEPSPGIASRLRGTRRRVSHKFSLVIDSPLSLKYRGLGETASRMS